MAAKPVLLRDPVERIGSLHEERRQEFEERGWGLADVYLELGGGGPRSSELHERFAEFFNGQTREALAAGGSQSKLEYWAGIPERGAGLRNEAIGALADRGVVDVAHGQTARAPDPRTRALILAHNQIDTELHAHFSAAFERGPRRSERQPRRQLARAAPGPPQAVGAPCSGAVCVLGMSRSGTSLTARILNILGVDLGSEEDLMEPVSGNNPAGFWEHKGIADLNEDILATLGDAPRQRWRWPPRLEAGWERDPRLARHRREARSILEQSFAGHSLWGWKDPRTCLTLPFWQRVLEEVRHVESRLRYVICVRHPLDVADSLKARDGLDREEAIALWQRYMSAAIVHTRGGPRTFVSYEGYFADRQGQLARLAEFLGRPRVSEAQRAAVAAHVDEGLWHNREAGRQESAMEGQPRLPPEVDDLHVLLTACSRISSAGRSRSARAVGR